MDSNKKKITENNININKSNQAKEMIKGMIISCEMLGGDPLREVELSEKLGYSRTPIREALKLLEAEGFVQFTPNKGAIVSKIDLADINELLEARMGIECFALKLCIRKNTQARLDKLKKCLEMQELMIKNSDYVSYTMYDRLFHQTIIEGSCNKKIECFWNSIMDQVQRAMNINVYPMSATSYGNHKTIVRAIEENDFEKACAEMEGHIQTVQVGLTKILLDQSIDLI